MQPGLEVEPPSARASTPAAERRPEFEAEVGARLSMRRSRSWVSVQRSTCEVPADYLARRQRYWAGRSVSPYLSVPSWGNRLDSAQIRPVGGVTIEGQVASSCPVGGRTVQGAGFSVGGNA